MSAEAVPSIEPSPPASMSALRRRVFLATVLVVWLPWLAAMTLTDRWSLLEDNAFMSATMVLGSLIAGATSEGGGAVAFPVMTLVFSIPPAVARDFSLMIQSVGMIAAGTSIVLTRIPVIRSCLLPTSLGGAIGVVLGLELVAPVLPPPFAKMLFTSLWLSFAVALWLINRSADRHTRSTLEAPSARLTGLLVLAGLLGGVVTSITGSGLDILTFSLLVLLLRISEQVATPTSVVLMGVNALVGATWKGTLGDGLEPMAWEYWWVCVPVVVVGAPLGAQLIRFCSRLFIARLLIASILIQFAAALLIIPQSPTLLAFSAAVFAAGLAGFSLMAWRGRRAVPAPAAPAQRLQQQGR